MRAVLFIPFAGLVILAGIVGFRFGQATSPSETATIQYWADVYVGEVGDSARTAHCAAKPHALPQVWMIIACAQPDTRQNARRYIVAANGTRLTEAQLTALEPDT